MWKLVKEFVVPIKGGMKFRCFTQADLVYVTQRLQNNSNNREFAAQILHHQLNTPKLPLALIRGLSGDDLGLALRSLIREEPVVFEQIQYTDDLFADIRMALTRYAESEITHLRDLARMIQKTMLASREAATKALVQMEKQDKKAASVLHKYKWFLCPSLPSEATSKILKIARKKGRKDRDINRLFVGYFSHNGWSALENMVNGWNRNTLMKRRIPIIRSCVSAVQASDRTSFNAGFVVLPSLLAQIDGFLADLIGTSKWKRKFKDNMHMTLTSAANGLAKHVILDVLFQSSRRGASLAVPFYFNRHKILHGESTAFGRKDYVVRAFMVLDCLASLDVAADI